MQTILIIKTDQPASSHPFSAFRQRLAPVTLATGTAWESRNRRQLTLRHGYNRNEIAKIWHTATVN